MSVLPARDVSFSSVEMERGLHQAVALASMTLLFTAHRAIMNSGFVLKRRGFSTDLFVVSVLGFLVCFWTGMVVLSSLQMDDRPCRTGFSQCAARMAYAPFIMISLFFFWVISYVDQLHHIRHKPANPTGPETQHIDPESMVEAHPSFEWARKILRPLLHVPTFHLGIWHMECAQGPLNWKGSIAVPYRAALLGTMFGIAGILSYGAFNQQLYTIGLLNFVGVILFAVNAAGSNTYMMAPHIYTRDTLRVMLHTRHLEGTSYILPCRDRGFDAVWGPKIKSENKVLDEAMHKWLDDGGYQSGKLPRMDKVMADFHSRTHLGDEDINDLAGWLYQPTNGNYATMRNPVCKRKKGAHLLASSVMLSLWQAEYLVMMRKNSLRKDLDALVGKIRSERRSGLDMKPCKQIGGGPNSKGGLKGYQEAIEYVYELFNQPVDPEATHPTSPVPEKSVVFRELPTTIDEYVGNLWTHCFMSQESTFAALWAFTIFWQADVGMDSSRGRHGFPFDASTREGDIVTWHIIWRQAWYQATIAQLTTMSPIIFSAFIAGILQ